MSAVSLTRPRMVVLLIIAGIVLTSFILTSNHHNYWGAFGDSQEVESTLAKSVLDQQLTRRLAIIFPVNNNTDMQFYRNTWMREYLYPVCDWSEPGCKIVCNKDSTYHTLDEKTFCFSREMKKFKGKEFFIKLDDDAFVDRDYILELMRKYTGAKKPVYISDHTRFGDGDNKETLDNVRYGNGKFYMFNNKLVKCLDTDFKYEFRPRNEDAVFGGMVRSGCGEENVDYIQENDDKIWHKEYKSKNKYINLAFIKNH